MSASLYDRLLARPNPEPGVPQLPPVEIIAFNVSVSRKLRGWKQSVLADLAGVSLSTVERVERGEKVRVEALERIGAAFGYPPAYYSRPRAPLSVKEMSKLDDKNNVFVEVKPLGTQPQLRELAGCDSIAFAPFGGVSCDDVCAMNLCELLADLCVRLLLHTSLPLSDRGGMREHYRTIFSLLNEMSRAGLCVIAGVLHEPARDCRRFGVLGIAQRSTDPGILVRKILILDRRDITGQSDHEVA